MATELEPVIATERDGVAVIMLNRPTQLNAINRPLLDGLNAALERAKDNDAISAILVLAAGRAFCAGDDLREFAGLEPDVAIAEDFVAQLQKVTRNIMLGPKPVVCAAQGYIVGGGAAWPLNADFTVLADDAVLFCPEAKYGLFPSGGVSILLSERCGPALANDVLVLGKRLTATDMQKAGIATQLAARANLHEDAHALARKLTLLPAASRARFKQARQNDIRDRLERAMAFETRCCVAAATDPDVRARAIAALRN